MSELWPCNTVVSHSRLHYGSYAGPSCGENRRADSRCAAAGDHTFSSCWSHGRAQYNGAQLTTQPLESNFRSDMQRKLRLQPPLSFVQSLTGPKESRRTSRESKEELIISSSLSKEQATKESQLHSWGSFWAFGPVKGELVVCLHGNYIK